MTLDTCMYVHDEVDVHQLFHHFRTLLGAVPQHPYKDREYDWGTEGGWSIGNDIGIGLPALVRIYYRPGEPLRADGEACSDSCDPEDDYHWHKPAMWCEVSMDTAYGYHDELGRGCGDLHAAYVAQLGQWLDERSVSWSWENEFTGDIHAGPDRYERLRDLISSAADASAWFQTTVAPAIAAGLR
jgi:hypothetical protein